MSGQHPTHTIACTQVHYLQSRHVAGEFKLFVAAPWTPTLPGQKVPVVFALDANAQFGTVVETVRSLQFGGELPPCYVVGIGYPSDNLLDIFSLRSRDYTPTPSPSFETIYPQTMGSTARWQTGGAARFLRFIREELKPWVNASLPDADPDDTTIAGLSFGGLFATYTLLNAPDTFRRYIACSPSLLYDGEIMLMQERELAAGRSDLSARVFIACGALETEEEMIRFLDKQPPALKALMQKLWRPRMVELVVPFVEQLHQRGYPSLELEHMVFENEHHMSVYPAALSRGLREVFKP